MTEKPQWTIPMRLEFRTNVTVEASSLSEARQKADACEFVDDGMKGAELVNWMVVGEPKKDEP